MPRPKDPTFDMGDPDFWRAVFRQYNPVTQGLTKTELSNRFQYIAKLCKTGEQLKNAVNLVYAAKVLFTYHGLIRGIQIGQETEKAKKRAEGGNQTRRSIVEILRRDSSLSNKQLCERLEQWTVPMPIAWHKVLAKALPGSGRYRWTEIVTIPELRSDFYAYVKRCRADAAMEKRLHLFSRLVDQHVSVRKEIKKSTEEIFEFFRQAIDSAK